MRKIPVNQLRPGMTVGHKLYNTRGDVLLNRGVVLTQDYIDCLAATSVPALYIDDGFVTDLEVDDVIDERTRIEAVNQLKEIWGRKTGCRITLQEEEAHSFRETVRCILEQLFTTRPIMVNIADIRTQDDYLFAHSVNVCVLSLLTGLSLGMDEGSLLELGTGALLHDIGKLLVPKEILDKPGKLTSGEFNMVKRHPEYSYEILLRRRGALGGIPAQIALQHHERYNGKGYPYGLAGKSINSLAQIVGLADVYDAMTADRVYRPAHSHNDVYEMLAASGGYFFEFRLVCAFLANVAAYPVGSLVVLSTGETGVVKDIPRGFALYPNLRIVFDSGGNYLEESYELQLYNDANRCIVRMLDNQGVEELNLRAGDQPRVLKS